MIPHAFIVSSSSGRMVADDDDDFKCLIWPVKLLTEHRVTLRPVKVGTLESEALPFHHIISRNYHQTGQ